MKTITKDGKNYRLPGGLSPFQEKLYLHLIDWKWKHITREPGKVRKASKAGEIKEYLYDIILPEVFEAEQHWPHLYPDIVAELKRHRKQNDFRIHKHFYHMASSQAANINLFLPLLHHPKAATILSAIKPDFASLATDELDKGYCIEYWGGNFGGGSTKGFLNDKQGTGTDSDIAIAYRNQQGELCLWLIEHKLTEREFTACGGYKSAHDKDNSRRKDHHNCALSFTEILANKASCYYHDVCGFDYWNITEAHRDFFVNHATHNSCPFKGGMNQLWRNQLLALAIAEQGTFTHVTFSVVRHPGNTALDDSLDTYQKLIDHNPNFLLFSSLDLVVSAERQGDAELMEWARWYRELYNL